MNPVALRRTLFSLLAVVVSVFAYVVLRQLGNDPDILPGKSAGLIAAVETTPDGSKIVLISPDGTIKDVPGHQSGKRDIDPQWRSDGQRLFFTSDREENTFHIFRFRPEAGESERRSLGSNSRSTPIFGPAGHPKANEDGIITSRGQVLEYQPRDGTTYQLLPPQTMGAAAEADGSGGTVDAFSAIYSRIGTSFKSARYGKDRALVVAVMRREEGEVLVVQSLEQVTDPGTGQKRIPRPIPVIAGASVDFDIAPSGEIFATVLDFQWVDGNTIPEEFIKNGRATVPYRHGMIMFDPSAENGGVAVLFQSEDDATAVSSPRVSPDGKTLLWVMGEVGEGDAFEPKSLFIAGLPPGVGGQPTQIATGPIREPAWYPSSDQVLFVQSQDRQSALFRLPITGGEPTRVTPEGRSFRSPTVSPQL